MVKVIYKITQTWLWQMFFCVIFATMFFPIPLVLPICVIGIVVEQPHEWPVLVIYFGCAIIGFLTFLFEDKLKYKAW